MTALKCPMELERFSAYANDTPGLHKSKTSIDWDIPLIDGSRLIDDQHKELLWQFQSFVEAAVAQESTEVRMAGGSVSKARAGIECLADFMLLNRLGSLSELDNSTSWRYLSHVEEWAILKPSTHLGRPKVFGYSSAYVLIHTLSQMYSLREAMRIRCGRAIPEAPYDGRRSENIVKHELGLTRKGKIEPVPDQVAIPVLQEAYKYIVYRAEEIIDLQKLVLACRTAPGPAGEAAVRNVLSAHQFQADPGESEPWRQPFAGYTRALLDGRTVKVEGVQELRRLIITLQTAAIIILQAGTGMRAHEVLSLRGRTSWTQGSQPAALTVRPSVDRMMDLFMIKGVTAKRGRVDTKWLCGIRPAGTEGFPITVKALRVLEELMLPWRVLGDSDSLLVSFKAGRGLPWAEESIGNLASSSMTNLQKEFALETLRAAGHAEGATSMRAARRLRGHQWRVSFAQFVFRASPDLVLPLRDHYKHMNEVITDVGYVGSNATQLEDLEGERVQATGQFLLALSMGQVAGAGAAAHLIRKRRELLLEEIKKAAGRRMVEKAVSIVLDNDVRIWSGTYATCLMRVLSIQSRCNDAVRMPDFLQTNPNFATRSPEMCAGCASGLILPDHKPKWMERRRQNQEIINAAAKRGLEDDGAVIIARKRVQQCDRVLRDLDRAISESSSVRHAEEV